MTRRYEHYGYDCCKASTIQKISAQENLGWHTVNDICQRGGRQELDERPVSNVGMVGMDELALKKRHRAYATVIVDLERIEMIAILEYREQAKLIGYFQNKGVAWCDRIAVFCSDRWLGFINTAKAVFPNATVVVDRFHFFGHLNKAVDSHRKSLRRQWKNQDEFKRLKGALLKNAADLTAEPKKKLTRALLLAPHLKLRYQHKEEFRSIFERRLTREQGEIELIHWLEQAKEMNNKPLNNFLYLLNDWKE